MDLADALQAPPVRRAASRSKYLEQALADIQASGQKISSWGELAAKLAASGITQYSKREADKALQEALVEDFRGRGDAILAGLGGTPSLADSLMPAQAPNPVATQPGSPGGQLPGAFGPPVPPMQPAAAAGHPFADIIARTVWGEARNESPEGQAAVAAVILNRARQSGLTPEQVIRAKGQFEPWMNPAVRQRMEALTPEQLAPILQAIQPALDGQDPTGGADHFYSPRAQAALRRAPPAWDNGSGRDLGGHRFFALGYRPPGSPGPQADEPSTWGDQSPQVPAPATGQAPTSPSPPAPASQAPAQEPPPGPVPPGPGGNPLQATPDEIALVRRLLSDPRTFSQGQALALKIQERAAAPQKAETVTMNGVPGYYNPYSPQGGVTPFAIPPQAMNRTVTPGELGMSAAPGTYMSVKPTGEVSTILAPQAGQMVTSGAGQPYREAPVPGGRNDIRQGGPRWEALQGVRAEVKPILDAATQLQRNVNAVRAGYAQQNGAGDIAMINGLQRLIDEGVVREGDVALQLKAQGLQGGIAGLQGFLQSSGTFSPSIRNQLRAAAEDIYSRTNQTYADRALAYRDTVERQFGPGSFRDVIPDQTVQAMGWASPAAPPATPGAPRQSAPQSTQTYSGPPLSPEEAKRLPKGTRFRGLDGKWRVRQ